MTVVFIRLVDHLNVQDGIDNKVGVQLVSLVPNKSLNKNCARIAPVSVTFSDNNYTDQ
jgi:hypothetical protein